MMFCSDFLQDGYPGRTRKQRRKQLDAWESPS